MTKAACFMCGHDASVAVCSKCQEGLNELLAERREMLQALRDSDDQGQHADGCRWWNHDIRSLDTPEGRAEADADCNCFVAAVRTVITKADKP